MKKRIFAPELATESRTGAVEDVIPLARLSTFE